MRVYEADSMEGVVPQGGDLEVTCSGWPDIEGQLSSTRCQMARTILESLIVSKTSAWQVGWQVMYQAVKPGQHAPQSSRQEPHICTAANCSLPCSRRCCCHAAAQVRIFAGRFDHIPWEHCPKQVCPAQAYSPTLRSLSRLRRVPRRRCPMGANEK